MRTSVISYAAEPKFFCPISGKIMWSPTTLTYGHTFDRSIFHSHPKYTQCPFSFCKRKIEKLTTNAEVLCAIQKWLDENCLIPIEPCQLAWSLAYPQAYSIADHPEPLASYLRFVRATGSVYKVAANLMTLISAHRIQSDFTSLFEILKPHEQGILEEILDQARRCGGSRVSASH